MGEVTCSPVILYSIFQYLLAITAELDRFIHQMDAVPAFLQGDLAEGIHMLPPDMNDHTNKLYRLRKNLCGLKQVSSVWNTELDGCLEDVKLCWSKLDSRIYHPIGGGIILISAVYVIICGMTNR
ncbi:hypothetical protein JTB14_028417 [Gonioctena quinquepunctata]|nr:hypothetical protein JTB14_028417 [Gonioctena quinquepunctata]